MRGTGALVLLAVALHAMPARGSLEPGNEPSNEPSNDASARLQLGGYVRTLAGIEQLRYQLAPDAAGTGPPDHLGLSATVLRLEWKAALGDRFSAEVHQRVFQRISSESLALGGSRLGLGASVAPRRTLDLRVVAYDEDRLLLEHDLDRLVLRANLGLFDVFLGRQAITWGTGELFPVADLWTTYSPFELDTSQKRGVDALRVLFSQSRAWEIEAVLADRGTLRDLSAGLRVASYRENMDIYFAIAKQWREMLAFAGVAATAGSFKLRAEAAGPYDLDQRDFVRPRLSLATDWLHSEFTLTLEAHYNGTGALQAAQYFTHLATSPALAHGESYLLGRLYTGAAASWKISELFQLTVSGMCNLHDPSALLAAAFTWRLVQETELSFGTFQGIGRSLLVGATPTMRSEFGSYGSLFYLALASYF
jgi:hypothetical protein